MYVIVTRIVCTCNCIRTTFTAALAELCNLLPMFTKYKKKKKFFAGKRGYLDWVMVHILVVVGGGQGPNKSMGGGSSKRRRNDKNNKRSSFRTIII